MNAVIPTIAASGIAIVLLFLSWKIAGWLLALGRQVDPDGTRRLGCFWAPTRILGQFICACVIWAYALSTTLKHLHGKIDFSVVPLTEIFGIDKKADAK